MSSQAGNAPTPNVANLVGQAGNLQSGIQQNLAGSVGSPDITQLMQQVNQMKSTQGQIMGTPASQSLAPGQPITPMGGGMKGK